MKLMDLLRDFNYKATGEIILQETLEMMDPQLPSDVKSQLDEFTDRIKKKESISGLMDSLREQVNCAYYFSAKLLQIIYCQQNSSK